jgi:hypothetical protein
MESIIGCVEDSIRVEMREKIMDCIRGVRKIETRSSSAQQ